MNPPYLLDTCTAMWLLDNQWMRQSAIDMMDRSLDLEIPLHVSPITAWEVGNLARVGRFRSSLTVHRWYEKLCDTPGIRLCELNADILLASSFLPCTLNTRDPTDRIIAATAREFGYTVMTRDESLLDYGRQGHLSVLEC